MNRVSRFAALIGMVVCALGVFAASASAIPPEATTGSATEIKDTKATLSGTINPKGHPTNYRFEYGPTTSYGFNAPVPPANAGEGTTSVPVSRSITGLSPSTTYHYRIIALGEEGTTPGLDKTFTTAAVSIATALSGMATTEPFDGSSTSLANFSANWGALGWASAKGEDTATGWRASGEYPSVSGAYLNQTLTDAGQGLGVSATMAAAPGSEGRYISLWLDMSNPTAASRAGYELRLTTEASGNYKAELSQWSGGSRTIFATKTGVALPAGSSVALTDSGSSVAAYANTGSGFTTLVSTTTSLLSSGKAGVEASGNVSRLTKFKAGALLTPTANTSESLAALRLRDAFLTTENPLSGGGAWAVQSWDSGTGQVYSTGWGSANPAPAFNGAYWQKAAFADTGAGMAASVVPVVAPGSTRYFSLWLDMPSPGSAKTGYEARFVDNGSGQLYETTIYKWQAGVKTSLGTTFVLIPATYHVAFVDKGSSLTIWEAQEASYSQAVSATDSAFNSGYAGIESSGNVLRLRDFRAGPLAPF